MQKTLRMIEHYSVENYLNPKQESLRSLELFVNNFETHSFSQYNNYCHCTCIICRILLKLLFNLKINFFLLIIIMYFQKAIAVSNRIMFLDQDVLDKLV